MSSITSKSYPVVTISKDGDLFAVVRDGNLKKMTRSALGEYIQQLAPNTLISLTDTPNSYAGQQGKGLVVNATEDAMEFAPTVSSNFLALTDTPSAYGGQANKFVKVNSAQNALEFIDDSFLAFEDTPSTYAGSASNIVRVNPGASGLEFVTPTQAAPSRNLTGGWFDYDNNAGAQAYSTPGTFIKVINDALGPNTRSDFAPAGVTTVYNGSLSQFDFSQLSLGDIVNVRVDMSVTTTSANQTVSVDMVFAIGATPFSIAFSRNQFKTAGAQQITPGRMFYIGETVLPNPAEVRFRSDANATINDVGWFVTVERIGAA